MNKVVLSGRWTKDPDVKYTGEGTAIARGTLAVDRRYKKDGEATADFINVVAFGKTAEHIEKWFFKGMKTAIVGRIQTGSFVNKEGQKIYTTDVVIEEVEFAEPKSDNNQNRDYMVQEKPAGNSEFKDAGDAGAEVFNY